jgi:hypothetical protein
VNICGSCDLDFGSLRAFDSHRVGKHAYDYSDDSLLAKASGKRKSRPGGRKFMKGAQ